MGTDLELIVAVAVCVIVLIWIPTLIIRRIKEHRRIKKAAKEAVKSATGKSKTAAVSPETKKAIDAAKEKAVKDTLKKFEPEKKPVSRVRTDAEEKKFEKPKESPKKSTASRVKTDPAFSEKKPSEKPKPKEAKPKSDMETETLLRVEKGKKSYWKCYYCGTENEKTASRCVVCTQEKPPTGI